MFEFYQHPFRLAVRPSIVIVAFALTFISCAPIKKTDPDTLKEAEQALGDIRRQESAEEEQRLHNAITDDQTLESQTKKQSKGTG